MSRHRRTAAFERDCITAEALGLTRHRARYATLDGAPQRGAATLPVRRQNFCVTTLAF